MSLLYMFRPEPANMSDFPSVALSCEPTEHLLGTTFSGG